MRHKLYILIIAAILLQSSLCLAQTQHCKARLRANRHKSIEYISLSFAGAIWEHDGVKIEMDFLPGGTDSVTALYNDHPPVIFHAKNNEIIDPVIIYQGQGGWVTDSINRSHAGAHHFYYDVFGSHNVGATQNEQQHSLRLYNLEGGDSLMIKRYANGLMERMEWYGRNGQIIVTKEWTREGILHKSKSDTTVSEYFNNGTLHAEMLDTIIEQRTIICHREYYENGVLKSVMFFASDTPCHVWRYYDGEGKLEKTIKKRPVGSLPISVKGPAYSQEPTIYSLVEQHADYPDGETAFKKFLDEQLPEALCTCESQLKGSYELHVCVSRKDCQMQLLSVTGKNADAAKRAIEPIISRSVHWRCAKIMGRPADQLVTLHVLVK